MYSREDALRDSSILHRLEKKKAQAIMEIDAEIADLEQELNYLNARKQDIITPIDNEIEYIKQNLIAWHMEQEDKTIKLPYANLKSRTQPQDYIKDEDALMEWVRVNADEFIRTEVSVDWSGLKKNIVVDGERVILSETGEIVDGLVAKPREVKYSVEVL